MAVATTSRDNGGYVLGSIPGVINEMRFDMALPAVLYAVSRTWYCTAGVNALSVAAVATTFDTLLTTTVPPPRACDCEAYTVM